MKLYKFYKAVVTALCYAFVGTLYVSAQETQKVTEIMIVEDSAPDNVKVNGKNTSVYQLQLLDSEPEYPGGINGLMSFLAQNLVYPESAMEGNIQGKVVVKFVVTRDGNVANVEVIKSVDPALDAEATRVISLLKGFTPGMLNGEKVSVWYTLPVNFKLQDDVPDIEEFDAVDIDSIGYQEMMDLGLKAQSENNLAHTTAYFKEAYHINPYSIDPLERIVKLNNANGKSDLNYDIYEYGVDQLTRWNQLHGTGNSAIFPMEWLAGEMQKINKDDLYPQFALLWTYLQAPSVSLRTKANDLIDKLIPLCEEQGLWDQYGHIMSLKTFFLTNEDDIISLYEPNVDKLKKSPQGSGALAILSRIYSEKKGDAVKAEKYMKMAEEADPERIELPKWLE